MSALGICDSCENQHHQPIDTCCPAPAPTARAATTQLQSATPNQASTSPSVRNRPITNRLPGESDQAWNARRIALDTAQRTEAEKARQQFADQRYREIGATKATNDWGNFYQTREQSSIESMMRRRG